jgi:hypothetical protein
MNYLSNLKLAAWPRPIEVEFEISPLHAELAHQAYLLCRVEDKSDPDISELNELIGFMLQELERAGEHGAEWFRNSINDKSISDNEYTRSFCTCEGYIDKEGPVNVLLNWSFSTKDGCIDWSVSPAYVRSLHIRHWAGLMMGAFALYKLNCVVASHLDGKPVLDLSSMKDLAQVVDAVAGGFFNRGWATHEQWVDDERSENGKAGAKARNEKYSQTRSWVLERYAARSWPSPRAASFEIAPQAIEFARNIGKPLSLQRAQVTVYEWILEENRMKRL